MWKKIRFQDRNSPIIEHLNFLHDHNITIVFIITFVVLISILLSILNPFFDRFFSENQEIEYTWTSLPSFILIFLAIPSIKILYITEEYYSPSLTIKITGHQWYWSYEYSDFENLNFDSFIRESKIIRLLETNNHIIIPRNISIRILISSDDVIHSWTIPRLGVKVDAVPGRINQLIFKSNRTGIFSGQCREICGANHSFIPITISCISIKSFSESLIKIYIKWPRFRQRSLKSFTAIAFNEFPKYHQYLEYLFHFLY